MSANEPKTMAQSSMFSTGGTIMTAAPAEEAPASPSRASKAGGERSGTQSSSRQTGSDAKVSVASCERLILTKQHEIDMLSNQNEQLRLSLDKLERELGDLANALAAKDKLLRAAQRKIDDREHELRQLGVVQSQSDGKDEAMKIAAMQNRSILQILQEANLKCENLERENRTQKAELQRVVFFNEKRMQRSVAQNERLRTSLKFAQKEITVNMLAKMASGTRAEKAEAAAKEARMKAEAEIAVHETELASRRFKQYLLTDELQKKSDLASRLQDDIAATREDHANEVERADELEARLTAAVHDLDVTEEQLRGLRDRALAEEARAASAEAANDLTNLRSEALRLALEATIDERRAVREKQARVRESEKAAHAASAAAEAAAERSLARHFATVDRVKAQKKHIDRLDAQLGNARTLIEKGRKRIVDELNDPNRRKASVFHQPQASTVSSLTDHDRRKKKAPPPRMPKIAAPGKGKT
jgi:hypothetical protein